MNSLSIAPPQISVKLSVLIPVYNEEESIVEIYRAVTLVLKSLRVSYEILFVDDGSKDQSFKILESIYQKDSEHVEVLSLSRNFGQHIALLAGLEQSNGEYVIMMDCDFQDSPNDIPRFYEKINEGYDCVYGIRMVRQDPLGKRMASGFFWKILNKVSGCSITSNQAMLRIMSRRFCDSLLLMPDQFPFIAGMGAWIGYRQTTLPVQQGKRLGGSTKYTPTKLFYLAWSAATSFSDFPLKVSSYFGIVISGMSFLAAIVLIVGKLVMGFSVDGWTSLIVTVCFLSGIQLLVLGVIGEYIGRSFQQSIARPRYITKEHLCLTK